MQHPPPYRLACVHSACVPFVRVINKFQKTRARTSTMGLGKSDPIHHSSPMPCLMSRVIRSPHRSCARPPRHFVLSSYRLYHMRARVVSCVVSETARLLSVPASDADPQAETVRRTTPLLELDRRRGTHGAV
jgi:hypothetical protein